MAGYMENFTFRILCPIWVRLGVRDLHVILFSILEFNEQRPKEGCTFPMDVMKLHLRVYCDNGWHLEIQEHVDKVCVLRRGVHCLVLL
jgi:hypothetical protein